MFCIFSQYFLQLSIFLFYILSIFLHFCTLRIISIFFIFLYSDINIYTILYIYTNWLVLDWFTWIKLLFYFCVIQLIWEDRHVALTGQSAVNATWRLKCFDSCIVFSNVCSDRTCQQSFHDYCCRAPRLGKSLSAGSCMASLSVQQHTRAEMPHQWPLRAGSRRREP